MPSFRSLRFALATGLFASSVLLAGAAPPVSSATVRRASGSYTFVNFPMNNSVQTNLINVFPSRTFEARNSLRTPFQFGDGTYRCGFVGNAACNFFDAFNTNGAGLGIVMSVSVANAKRVYTLMNAYQPPAGSQIGTIQFIGSQGAVESFSLVAGANVRDFFQGSWANTLNNSVAGVLAVNAFQCYAPVACLGAGDTGHVTTGSWGTYVIDEQAYTLSSRFQGQDLVQIVITDTANGPTPILLGITVES